MKCIENGCNGEFDIWQPPTILIFGNCYDGIEFISTFSCNTCGRLYRINNEPFFTDEGEKVFVINDKIITRT